MTLPVLQSEFFRCEAYACVMRRAACARRHEIANDARKAKRGTDSIVRSRFVFTDCRGCQVGAENVRGAA